MDKRKTLNIVCIVLGLVVLSFIFFSSSLWEKITYAVIGLSSMYVGISGLKIK